MFVKYSERALRWKKREQTIFCKNDDWQGFQLLYFYTKVEVAENQFHNQYNKIKIRMKTNEILILNIKLIKKSNYIFQSKLCCK